MKRPATSYSIEELPRLGEITRAAGRLAFSLIVVANSAVRKSMRLAR